MSDRRGSTPPQRCGTTPTADPSLAKGPSGGDWGARIGGLWETSGSRDTEKASERAPTTDKDKPPRDTRSFRGKREALAHGVGGGRRRATAGLCVPGFLRLSRGFYQEREAGVKAAKLILMTN